MCEIPVGRRARVRAELANFCDRARPIRLRQRPNTAPQEEAEAVPGVQRLARSGGGIDVHARAHQIVSDGLPQRCRATPNQATPRRCRRR